MHSGALTVLHLDDSLLFPLKDAYPIAHVASMANLMTTITGHWSYTGYIDIMRNIILILFFISDITNNNLGRIIAVSLHIAHTVTGLPFHEATDNGNNYTKTDSKLHLSLAIHCLVVKCICATITIVPV